MDWKRVEKRLSLYERGIVTRPEIANSFLLDLIRDESADADLPSLIAKLPDEVRRNLLDLLRSIRQANCCWKPFLIGPGGGSVLDSEAEDSARLRRLCALLQISEGPMGEFG